MYGQDRNVILFFIAWITNCPSSVYSLSSPGSSAMCPLLGIDFIYNTGLFLGSVFCPGLFDSLKSVCFVLIANLYQILVSIQINSMFNLPTQCQFPSSQSFCVLNVLCCLFSSQNSVPFVVGPQARVYAICSHAGMS